MNKYNQKRGPYDKKKRPGVLVINSQATAIASFEGEAVHRFFRCKEKADLEKMEHELSIPY